MSRWKEFWACPHLCHVCAVLHPTNSVNYKGRLIATPAFGNYDFWFCQDTFFWLSSLQFVQLSKLQWAHQQVSVSTVILYQQPAVSTVVLYQQAGAGIVVLYQPSCFSDIVPSLQHKRLSPNCKKKGFWPLPWILDWSRLLKDTNTCYVQMYCSLGNG
jgi:hypothetical protein